MKLPIIIYGIVIMTMLCKASILGIEAMKSGITPLCLICAVLGAVNFVMSDFSISFLMFDKKQKKNFKLKLFNMYTYFAAEILLASLIYFIWQKTLHWKQSFQWRVFLCCIAENLQTLYTLTKYCTATVSILLNEDSFCENKLILLSLCVTIHFG